MPTTQNIVIDLNTRGANPVAFTHQGDTARSFVFEVYNDGEAFTLTGYTAKIGAMLPADRGYYVIAGDDMATGSISGNKITVTLPAAYTAKSGNGVLTIILTGSGATIRPINVDFRIQKSADADDTVAGASDFPASLAQIVDDWITDNSADTVTQWLEDALDVQSLEDVIGAWFEAHPEATTTILDGSVSFSKLASDLKGLPLQVPFINEAGNGMGWNNLFVTPEMFGAKGDGVTDDAAAIQDAIDSGYDVYLPSAQYLIDSQIVINLKQNFSFNASGSNIVYSGNDYAVLIQRTQWSNIYFGQITATNGGCIKLYTARANNQGDNQYDYVHYVNIYFNVLSSLTNCIYANSTNIGWLNEIRIHGGKLAAGAAGVKILHNSGNGISHWVFDNVGIEGVTKGFDFEVGAAAETAGKYITDFEFYGLRTGEASNIFTTSGKCTRFVICGAYDVPSTKCSLSSASDDWLILAPGTVRTIRAGAFLDIDLDYIDAIATPISIPNNSDLNAAQFFKEGRYKSGGTSAVQNYSNCPVSVAFVMTVESSAIYAAGANRYVWRQIQSLTNTGTFLRQYAYSNDSGATWTTNPWYAFTGTEVT